MAVDGVDEDDGVVVVGDEDDGEMSDGIVVVVVVVGLVTVEPYSGSRNFAFGVGGVVMWVPDHVPYCGLMSMVDFRANPSTSFETFWRLAVVRMRIWAMVDAAWANDTGVRLVTT